MKNLLLAASALFLTLTGVAQDVSKLYQKVNPSVVTIKVEEKEVITDRSTMTKTSVTMEGLGSGVVISESGEIMTAAHVISAAEKVIVEFPNGDEVPAKVVTSNTDADVALVKLLWIPKDMQVATLGNSDEVRIGHEVIVIGAPLGLKHSLSMGHISGRIVDENISDNFTKQEFFQTDAAINHGNSGGPMFNMKGEVIGIVSFILSESGGFEGLGFAVTSKVAKQELLGKQPFWFGLTFEPLVGPAAEIFNVPQEMGLLVQKVATNSPSDIAGVQAGVYKVNIEGNSFMAGGDIILQVGNFKMEPKIDQVALRKSMSEMKPGDQLAIKVLRAGIIKDLIIIVPE